MLTASQLSRKLTLRSRCCCWSGPSQSYVLRRSGMAAHASPPVPEQRHPTAGGPSGRDDVRRHFFSPVPCADLLRLRRGIYRMDFDLFEYGVEEFMEMCVKEE